MWMILRLQKSNYVLELGVEVCFGCFTLRKVSAPKSQCQGRNKKNHNANMTTVREMYNNTLLCVGPYI